MNADMLTGDCISVLEYRSVALSAVGRGRAPRRNVSNPISPCFHPRPRIRPIWSAVLSVPLYLLQLLLRL